jgi:hypothetical protein
MARDFLRPAGAPRNSGPPGQPATTGRSAAPVLEPAVASGPEALAAATTRPVDDDFELGSDVMFGSAHAIELGSADSASVIDEAAILFANGQDDPAEAVLRAAIEADQLGAATRPGSRS